MISIVKTLKDGEYLVDEATAIKAGSSLIAEFDDASDAVKAQKMHQAIENNNIKASLYITKGKNATAYYKTVDLGVDVQALIN